MIGLSAVVIADHSPLDHFDTTPFTVGPLNGENRLSCCSTTSLRTRRVTVAGAVSLNQRASVRRRERDPFNFFGHRASSLPFSRDVHVASKPSSNLAIWLPTAS